jgi:5'-deoxynucleotidase YfbR-like HD superfamily hydrolase
MLSGRRLDLLDPSPLDIEISDIAHGLARVARWNGQTHGEHAFSVAEHSVIVERVCQRLKPDWPYGWRLGALLHDAAEYVIGDMISPFKAALGYDYKIVEARLEGAVNMRYGLPAELPAEIKAVIKRADKTCAFFEATQIAGFSTEEARKLFGRPPAGVRLTINPLSAPQAQAQFLDRFEQLLAGAERERAR